MACIECFQNYGLKQIAKSLIISRNETFCERCGSKACILEKNDLDQILSTLFIDGSVPPLSYPGAPIYKAAESYPKGDIQFLTELDQDLSLLEEELDLGLFFYGPPTWMVGITDYWHDLNDDDLIPQNRNDVLNKVIGKCAKKILDENFDIFRVRAEEELPPAAPHQLDTPPTIKAGRYNTDNFPVFYGATDVETCLHEARATLADHILLGLFRPSKKLTLLDLTDTQETINHPSEDVSIFFEGLFYSDSSGYHLNQELSAAIKEKGYDGFITKSYYNQAHENDLTNISIFGHPVKENKLKLISTNSIRLQKIKYDFTFGPVNNNTLPLNIDDVHARFDEQAQVMFNSNLSKEEGLKEMEKIRRAMFPKSDVPI